MNLTNFLKDPFGNESSMRLVFYAWALGVLGVWIATSIKNGTMADIPEPVQWALGIVVSGKTIQRGFESQQDGAR